MILAEVSTKQGGDAAGSLMQVFSLAYAPVGTDEWVII